MEKKITRTTIKNFIAREFNAGRLMVKGLSTFDGMIDCVSDLKDDWHKATSTNRSPDYTLGINGLWFVGQSRDYFTAYADDNYIGYEVSNCCGSFLIAFHR